MGKLIHRLFPPVSRKLMQHAMSIVKAIEADVRFKGVVTREGNIAFCPRCGQLPQSDYRHEQAFEAIALKFPSARRSDIHLAIELAHKVL